MDEIETLKHIKVCNKTGKNYDEDNAGKANSNNDKSVNKIAVKQFDQHPSSIVNL